MDDHELLSAYLGSGSQEAFSRLVSRHLDFVYSCAVRQVRSQELAKDVSQSVFLELARSRVALKPGASLTPWLYVVTRCAARNALRAERRREVREHAAYEISTMNALPSVWSAMEPLLDEALASLNAHDRTAVLLRYFENKPLRAVSSALGGSEDAAQKRVSRAVERLRLFYANRGIAVTAAGLASELSAHAIQTAPLAVSSVISGAAILQSSFPGAIATLTMTTLQKTFIAAALAVAVGGAVYEVRVNSQKDAELAALAKQNQKLTDRVQAVARQRDSAVNERDAADLSLAASSAATSPKISPSDSPTDVAGLKKMLEPYADKEIPELRLLTDEDWQGMLKSSHLDTEAHVRLFLETARRAAKQKLAMAVYPILKNYAAANGGAVPSNWAEIEAFIQAPVDREMIQRYDFLNGETTGTAADANTTWVLQERSAVDPELDSQARIGLGTAGGYTVRMNTVSVLKSTFDQAMAAYVQAAGAKPTEPAQLVPYLPSGFDPVGLEMLFQSKR